ncbi:hypothetical protein BD780_000427 [Clostridium tetanomorphum]|nr:hypothetical protein [Clostridium tetanomorphum]NRS83202.1 hypothetical protein [Clostridium tetanomorphum]NRZ98698.1 hypothetical protein [Clostridium tetanomorphum]SQC01250.1 Uncharacterised protein [Clostridium tetanomorphum]
MNYLIKFTDDLGSVQRLHKAKFCSEPNFYNINLG